MMIRLELSLTEGEATLAALAGVVENAEPEDCAAEETVLAYLEPQVKAGLAAYNGGKEPERLEEVRRTKPEVLRLPYEPQESYFTDRATYEAIHEQWEREGTWAVVLSEN